MQQISTADCTVETFTCRRESFFFIKQDTEIYDFVYLENRRRHPFGKLYLT